MHRDQTGEPESSPSVEPDAGLHLASALPLDLSIGEAEPDLLCPSCGSDLIGDELFLSHRMCGHCRRHFSMPARERLGLLIDPGTFIEFDHEGESFAWPQQAPRSIELGEALVTGAGLVGGTQAVHILLDDHLIAGAIGALMADRIIRALESALTRRIPVVLVCAGGVGRSEGGPLTMIQPGRLASIFTQLHLGGIPIVALLTHPTSVHMFSALAAPADIILAEPGAQVVGGSGPDAHVTTDQMVEGGWIDGVVDRSRIRSQVIHVLDLITNRGPSLAPGAVTAVSPTRPATWTALAHARHADRPDGRHYIEKLFGTLAELRGDRIVGDDPGTMCGLGRLDGMTVAVVAQDRANMAPYPASAAIGARKVARLARLAGRLELPLVILVDRTQSDDVNSASPEVSHSIAALSMALAVLPVPVIAIGIGETSGPVSHALMSGDRQFMQENAISSCAPRGTAGPAGPGPLGVGRPGARDWPTVMTAHEHLRLGLIDGVIAEPSAGAHRDPEGAVAGVHATLQHALSELSGTGQRRLLDIRMRRQRSLGQSTPEGLAAARSELWELQEWQRSLTRSIDDWRERWDNVRSNQPRLSFQRPDLTDLTNKLRARRTELLDRAGRNDRGERS